MNEEKKEDHGVPSDTRIRSMILESTSTNSTFVVHCHKDEVDEVELENTVHCCDFNRISQHQYRSLSASQRGMIKEHHVQKKRSELNELADAEVFLSFCLSVFIFFFFFFFFFF